MTGVGEPELARPWVEDQVDQGGHLGERELRRELLHPAQHRDRGRVLEGVGTHGHPELAHRRGSLEAVTGHVPDDQTDQATGQRDDVVPVAADVHVGRCGYVARGECDTRDLGEARREQAALEGLGDLVLPTRSRLLTAQLLLGFRAVADLAEQLGVGRGELGRTPVDPFLELERATSSASAARIRSLTSAAMTKEASATHALKACKLSICSNSGTVSKAPGWLAADHVATSDAMSAAGAAPRSWRRHVAQPTIGRARNSTGVRTDPSQTRHRASTTEDRAASSNRARRPVALSQKSGRQSRKGATTSTPIASPVHHTAPVERNSSAGMAPETIRRCSSRWWR